MNMLWEPEKKEIKSSLVTVHTCWSSWGYLFFETMIFKRLCRKEGKWNSVLVDKCWQSQWTFPPDSDLLFPEHSVPLFSKGTEIWLHQILFWGFRPEFHGGEQQFRRNLTVVLPCFWRKLVEEFEVATGNTDPVEGWSKTEVDELNARFDAVWRWNQTKPN